MPDHDRLYNLILDHWRNYRPGMLSQLQKENRLEQALEDSQARVADLLYELISVRKMEYRQAWELAMEEVLLPEE